MSKKDTKFKNTHGMSRSRPYKIWEGMMNRCRNPKMINYNLYGGRGIKVCERWKKFENFWEDMGKSYSSTLTIDRIDGNGDYSFENCRWATNKEQSNNTSKNRLLIFNGQTKTLAQWAEQVDISGNVLFARLRLGWSTEKLLTTAVRFRRKSKIDE